MNRVDIDISTRSDGVGVVTTSTPSQRSIRVDVVARVTTSTLRNNRVENLLYHFY